MDLHSSPSLSCENPGFPCLSDGLHRKRIFNAFFHLLFFAAKKVSSCGVLVSMYSSTILNHISIHLFV